MNQRILDLMLEAGFAAPEVAGRARKLAQLLIEACAKECENQDPRPDQWSEMSEYAESRMAKQCAKQIRNKFKDE